MLPILLLSAACGIPDDRMLTDLDADLRQRVCEQMIAEVQPRTVTCDGIGEIDYEPNTLAECVDSLVVSTDCTATLGEFTACNDAIEADPCLLLDGLPPACDPVLACADVATEPSPSAFDPYIGCTADLDATLNDEPYGEARDTYDPYGDLVERQWLTPTWSTSTWIYDAPHQVRTYAVDFGDDTLDDYTYTYTWTDDHITESRLDTHNDGLIDLTERSEYDDDLLIYREWDIDGDGTFETEVSFEWTEEADGIWFGHGEGQGTLTVGPSTSAYTFTYDWWADDSGEVFRYVYSNSVGETTEWEASGFDAAGRWTRLERTETTETSVLESETLRTFGPHGRLDAMAVTSDLWDAAGNHTEEAWTYTYTYTCPPF